MISQLREALASYDDGVSDDTQVIDAMHEALSELLGEPTNVQALALARLMRDRPNEGAYVVRGQFDLPAGYWSVQFAPSGFTCGIAPDGSVSS